MQENDRVPTSDGDVTHIAVKNTYATTEIIVFGGDRHDIPPFAIGGRRKSDLELVKLPKINAPEVIKFTERPAWRPPKSRDAGRNGGAGNNNGDQHGGGCFECDSGA